MPEAKTRVTWLSAYDRLWPAFRKEFFRFEDAMSKIFPRRGRFSARQLKYASKILNEIEDNGYAIHKKAEYDQRVYVYRLLSPEKVTEAWGAYAFWSLGKRATYIDRIAEDANRIAKWSYMKVKDSAVAFWTNHYRKTDVFHFSVTAEDLDGWISLYKLFDYTVIVGGIVFYETKTKHDAVHFHPDLSERLEQEKEMKGHVQPLHYAVAESIADNDLLGTLAMLLRNVKKMDWERVINAALEYHVINALGFSMEELNKHAGKEIFDYSAINKIHGCIEKKVFAISGNEVMVRAGSGDLEKKWNVKCSNYSAFEKAVLDLV